MDSRLNAERMTFPVPDGLFRAVYDSPDSLPGAFSWITPDEDVRAIEGLLGIAPGSIGAPLWVSGDAMECPSCGRRTSWLDILSSALREVHRKELLVRVILGHQKFVNIEAPEAIPGVVCYGCGTTIEGIRSFKCHNWAYAIDDLARAVRESAGV